MSYQIEIICLIKYKDLLKYVLAIHSQQINCFRYVQFQQKHGYLFVNKNTIQINNFLIKVNCETIYYVLLCLHLHTILKLFCCKKIDVIKRQGMFQFEYL